MHETEWACEIALSWIPKYIFDVNTGSGNGLVSSDNKPLPGTILTYIYSGADRRTNKCAVCGNINWSKGTVTI